MRLNNKLSILVLTLMALVASGYAQSPSEKFKTAIAEFQKTATNENALKVIELFKQIEPPPTVPEEAREPFVIANTMLKKASDTATAAKAVESYDKAIHFAPWWADAYFNRAVARETAGQFDKAIDDLKLFLAFNLTDTERREAQDKIYALKAEAELAASKKTKDDEQAAITAEAKRFEGNWYNDVSSHDGSRSGARFLETLSIKRNALGVWQVQFLFTRNSVVQEDFHPYDVRFFETELRFKKDSTFGVKVVATYEITTTLSAADTLKLAYKPMPFTATQEAHWAEWNTYVPKPRVDEFKRQ